MFQKIDIKNISITQGFWKEKRELVNCVTVPYIAKALNNEIPGIVRSGAVENFEIASGRIRKKFHGLVSQDSDLYKWMEAASYSLCLEQKEDTQERLLQAIGLLDEAQQKDGYLNSYYIINGLKNKWGYLKESCQLYCAGHLFEAAAAYYEVTGKTELLDIAGKYADCIGRHFGLEKGKIHGYDGHAEIELALYRLYEAAGNVQYLELADYFVEERGKKPYFFSEEERMESVGDNLVYQLEEEDYHHSQSHLPVREQKEAMGHAVKACYFYTAAADKARIHHDKTLMETVKNLWKDVTEKKMFLSGAIGSCAYGESFSYAYDLPPGLMYGETCASIGLFIWGYHLLLLENSSKYSDVMELALYNNILAGISASGKEFFYTNALEVDPERCRKRKDYSHIVPNRQPWFECPCCPPNIARLLLSLQKYIATAGKQEINIHFYIGCELKTDDWEFAMRTDYPADGRVFIRIRNQKGGRSVIRIRKPGWCRHYHIFMGDKEIRPEIHDGYFILAGCFGEWTDFRLEFEMKPYKVYAGTEVKALAGMSAVMRGPVLYCAEQWDNGELFQLFSAKGNGNFQETGSEIKMDGYQCKGADAGLYSGVPPRYEKKSILLRPYAEWNNHGEGQMRVFFMEV